jgi:hypothetical protein
MRRQLKSDLGCAIRINSNIYMKLSTPEDLAIKINRTRIGHNDIHPTTNHKIYY